MFKYYMFQLLRAVDRAIPRRAAYRLGALIADLFFFFSRRSKPNYLANLLHVLKYLGEDVNCPDTRRKVRRLARRNFRNFASYLVDFFRFSRLEARHLSKLVEVIGMENVDRARSQGRGAIGVTAHVGNWELGGIVFALLGYPVNAVALSHQNTKLNRLFVNQRAIAGVKVISVGRAAISSLRALKRNEVVVILGDRDVTERGTRINFFGSPAFFPRGPAVLAIRSGAPLFFGYLIRITSEQYRVVFHPPLDPEPRLAGPEEEGRLMGALVKEMEQVIADHLDQWYVYYRIWPEDRF